IHVVLDVLFATPDDLHGSIDMLSDLDREERAVGLEPATKAAAQQMIVELDGVLGHPGELRNQSLCQRRGLGSQPKFATVLTQMNRTVHRFHRSVGKKRQPIGDIEALSCFGERTVSITLIASDCSRLVRSFLQLAKDVISGQGRVRTAIPLDLSSLKSLLGGPGMVGDYGHGVVYPDNLPYALDRKRRRLIYGFHLPAKGR